jgi:predicted trehalose synthase
MVPTISPTVIQALAGCENAPAMTEDAAFRALVQRTTDAILVALGTQLDAARRSRGWTVERVGHEARLSKRALVMHRKTQCNPQLGSLVAQALALGGVLEVTFRPGGAAGRAP